MPTGRPIKKKKKKTVIKIINVPRHLHRLRYSDLKKSPLLHYS